MRASDPATVSRLELVVLRCAALVSTVAAAVLLVLLLQLGGRVARAEAAERDVSDRLLRIYERVRRVQVIMEKRAEKQGLVLPPAPELEGDGEKPSGR